jgi:hypothetical protein
MTIRELDVDGSLPFLCPFARLPLPANFQSQPHEQEYSTRTYFFYASVVRGSNECPDFTVGMSSDKNISNPQRSPLY